MKSMLVGLDLSPKLAYYIDRDDGALMLLPPVEAAKLDAFSPDAYTTPYVDGLRKALEAALSFAWAQHVYITCVPDHESDEAMAEVDHRQALLETALEPFRVAGDDTKDGVK
jgi:hypothetical protein